MSSRASIVTAAVVPFARESAVPLYQQICEGLRNAILSGHVPSGTKLPSTRSWAMELGLSRNSVANAFEQLIAEGYLEARHGSGTYISVTLPDELLKVRGPERLRVTRRTKPALSKRGLSLTSTGVSLPRRYQPPVPFQSLPALDAFPFQVWGRLLMRHWRNASHELLSYSDAAGFAPLRRAITNYLNSSRGMRCEPEQIIVVGGSQQALDLAARLLLDPGDEAWMEDPGYNGAYAALLAAGARVMPIPVDEEGMVVAHGLRNAPRGRLAYVTPSHQYPLGPTMSLSRRLALLDWAKQNKAWVIEDDYDSAYRYRGRPVSAMQGLDDSGRVIYLGTFSKVLLPSLRIGYLVVPHNLVDAFVEARMLVGLHSPTLEQAALADFLEEGHFARHIRRMRTLYAERQAALMEAIKRELPDCLEVNPDDAGMSVVGWLRHGLDDRKVCRALSPHNLFALPISNFSRRPLRRSGLILGYTLFNQEQIASSVARLAAALDCGRSKEVTVFRGRSQTS